MEAEIAMQRDLQYYNARLEKSEAKYFYDF